MPYPHKWPKGFSGNCFLADHKLHLHPILLFAVRWQLFLGTPMQKQMLAPVRKYVETAVWDQSEINNSCDNVDNVNKASIDES